MYVCVCVRVRECVRASVSAYVPAFVYNSSSLELGEILAEVGTATQINCKHEFQYKCI